MWLENVATHIKKKKKNPSFKNLFEIPPVKYITSI